MSRPLRPSESVSVDLYVGRTRCVGELDADRVDCGVSEVSDRRDDGGDRDDGLWSRPIGGRDFLVGEPGEAVDVLPVRGAVGDGGDLPKWADRLGELLLAVLREGEEPLWIMESPVKFPRASKTIGVTTFRDLGDGGSDGEPFWGEPTGVNGCSGNSF